MQKGERVLDAEIGFISAASGAIPVVGPGGGGAASADGIWRG